MKYWSYFVKKSKRKCSILLISFNKLSKYASGGAFKWECANPFSVGHACIFAIIENSVDQDKSALIGALSSWSTLLSMLTYQEYICSYVIC